jgi:hypothetical protein
MEQAKFDGRQELRRFNEIFETVEKVNALYYT